MVFPQVLHLTALHIGFSLLRDSVQYTGKGIRKVRIFGASVLQNDAASLVPMDAKMDIEAVLVGEWKGAGRGVYPTISPFEYTETLTFASSGRPFLTYLQRTLDPQSGTPLHTECGYLRLIGNDVLELVVAQPTGVVEVHDGVVLRDSPGELVLRFSSRAVAVSGTAKLVQQVTREFMVKDQELKVSLAMAAVGQPLQDHLSSHLVRSRD